MECSDHIKALFIVVNAGYTDEIMDLIRAEGAGGATVINARGEGGRHESFMGITVDSEKELILTIVDVNNAKRIMSVIKEKAGRNSPIHGVCIAIPVNKAVGLNTGALLENGEDKTEKK